MAGHGKGTLTLQGFRPATTDAQDEMDDFVPTNWTDAPTGVNLDFPYEYVSQRKGTTGDWGKYSLPALWGRYADDGATVEYIYIRTTTEDCACGADYDIDPGWYR